MKKLILSIFLLLTFIYASDLFRGYESKYNRDNWPHWKKNVSGCLNLRHFLLERTSLEPVSYHSERKCSVKDGKWYGAYTNDFYYYSSQLDIDHIVPLAWAAARGAINWSNKKKREFANDIDNLIPVSKFENRKKGANGFEVYLPPNKEFHCVYIMRFDAIVSKYKLTYTNNEIAFLKKHKEACI